MADDRQAGMPRDPCTSATVMKWCRFGVHRQWKWGKGTADSFYGGGPCCIVNLVDIIVESAFDGEEVPLRVESGGITCMACWVYGVAVAAIKNSG